MDLDINMNCDCALTRDIVPGRGCFVVHNNGGLFTIVACVRERRRGEMCCVP